MIKDFSVIFDANHRLQLPSPGPRLNGRLLSNEELNELLIFQDSNFEYFFFFFLIFGTNTWNGGKKKWHSEVDDYYNQNSNKILIAVSI